MRIVIFVLALMASVPAARAEDMVWYLHCPTGRNTDGTQGLQIGPMTAASECRAMEENVGIVCDRGAWQRRTKVQRQRWAAVCAFRRDGHDCRCEARNVNPS